MSSLLCERPLLLQAGAGPNRGALLRRLQGQAAMQYEPREVLLNVLLFACLNVLSP